MASASAPKARTLDTTASSWTGHSATRGARTSSEGSVQLHPSHHAEDIGATFTEPSSFKVLTRTTGVPQ